MVSPFEGHPQLTELDIARTHAVAATLEPYVTEHELFVPEDWKEPLKIVEDLGAEQAQTTYVDLASETAATLAKNSWRPVAPGEQLGIGFRKARKTLTREASQREINYLHFLRGAHVIGPMATSHVSSDRQNVEAAPDSRPAFERFVPRDPKDAFTREGVMQTTRETVRHMLLVQLAKDSEQLGTIITEKQQQRRRRVFEWLGRRSTGSDS